MTGGGSFLRLSGGHVFRWRRSKLVAITARVLTASKKYRKLLYISSHIPNPLLQDVQLLRGAPCPLKHCH